MNIRQFKKKYYLCKDDFGNKLYPGDTVEILLSMGNKHPYQSKIYWNMVDGAFVECSPVSKIFEKGRVTHNPLRSVLKQKPFYYNQYDSDETVAQYGYCKKIKSVFNS